MRIRPVPAAERWREARVAHERETAALTAIVAAIPADRWLLPLAEEKWSPAEIVEHLCLVYEALEAELRGAPGMRLRTARWQRVVLRFTVLPRLLAGAPFPRGVRAPREVRPAEIPGDREGGIERFDRCAGRFLAVLEEARADRPRARLTHAYLGRMSLPEALRFTAAHVRHHAAQLEGAR